jgi:Leucine-rich repeat (LRR) protein
MPFFHFLLARCFIRVVAASSIFLQMVMAQVPSLEITALLDLHNSTNGDSWQWANEIRNGPRWNFTLNAEGEFADNPCSSGWQGVTCSREPQFCAKQTCRITHVFLDGYALSGRIPKEIGNLLVLEDLDLDSNALTGSIPSEVGNCVALTSLSLDKNSLSGSIPGEIGNLVLLNSLSLYTNELTGNIPGEIGNLVKLEDLVLDGNSLTGSIPSEIGNLVMLENLYLFNNALSGSIPSDIGNLLALRILSLYDNALTGEIPSELGNLVLLETPYLYNNALTGTIPSEIGNLVSLKVLYLGNNSLTGSIPNEIGSLVDLELLLLESNILTGSVPTDIGHLVNLELLYLYDNALTGSIPAEVGNLLLIRWLYMYDNALIGEIPTQIGKLAALELFLVENNALSGSIPTEIGKLVSLELLYLESNALTGSIPSEIGALLALEYLYMHSNLLTGRIPAEIGNCLRLERVDLEGNALTGSLPREMGGLVSLERLDLDNNALSGAIPGEIGKLGRIESVLLQNNRFTGSIDHIFNSSVQSYLEVLDMSNNLLSSGFYSKDLFRLPALRVLALSGMHINHTLSLLLSLSSLSLSSSSSLLLSSLSDVIMYVVCLNFCIFACLLGAVNCFRDALPTAMCEAAAIEVLSLNGLGAAESCKNTLNFPFSKVLLFNSIGGTLPECVWHLRNLTTLHMTGNGLTGNLISRLPHNSPLADLLLSHNKFSGSIPLNMQKVQRVDLSFNQLSGQYEGSSVEIWRNTFVDFEINRLSGHLPVSKLDNVSNLSILRGNMFSCDTIPVSDEFVDDYICGSEDFNEALYVFSSALFLACCIALVACFAALAESSSSFKAIVVSSSSLVDKWLSLVHSYMIHIDQVRSADIQLEPIMALRDQFKRAKQLSLQLLFVILVIGAPIYIIRGSDDKDDGTLSTHTNTYSWFWTLAYLRGVIPSSLILMLWCAAISVCFVRIILVPSSEEFSAAAGDSKPSSLQNFSRKGSLGRPVSSDAGLKNDGKVAVVGRVKAYGWIVAVLLANGAVTIAVNVLYVYATHQPLSVFILFVMQFSLAIYRMVYSYVVFPVLSQTVTDAILNIGFRLRLLIVNNLIIPCIATAFTSPSCFQV